MKVGVIVGTNFRPTEGGGFGVRAALLDAILKSSGQHEFIVLDLPSAVEPPPTATKSSIVRRAALKLRRMAGYTDPPAEDVLKQRIRDAQVDCVWFLSPNNAPVDVPFIATVWDLQHRLQPFFPEVSSSGWTWGERERNYQALLPRAARIITGTHAGKDEIVRFFGIAPETVRVVPLPAPPLAVASVSNDARPERAKSRPFIFYPAQFWPHKNHVNLLFALELLKRQSGLELDLVFTGADKGNADHVAKTAEKLGVASQVRWRGFVSEYDIEELYRDALALVYPSFFGPDNLPPLEAFAQGCPVAAARVSGTEEQLGSAALFFSPADPGDIARAIKLLHDDERLRERLIDAGRTLVAERTPAQYVAKIEAILDEFEAFRRSWGRSYHAI